MPGPWSTARVSLSVFVMEYDSNPCTYCPIIYIYPNTIYRHLKGTDKAAKSYQGVERSLMLDNAK